MSNHFSYLLKQADAAPAVSADRLSLMAKTASRRYLGEGTPMNDTIRKLAAENDLNHHQIERVCEMANIATHQTLWPAAQEKEKIAFPVASPREITLGPRSSADESGGGYSSPPSVDSDYMGPPSLPTNGRSLADVIGCEGAGHEGMHHETPRQKMIIVIEKNASEQGRIKDQLIVETMRWESEKMAAYRAVKQEVLSGTSLARIQDAAYSVGLGKIAAEVLPGFRDRLLNETHGQTRIGLEKVAIAPAPEEYISNELGSTTVVNGAHPVLVTLDLLHKRDGSIRDLHAGLSRVNDELKVYSQHIREL